ncbi:hypothetical protein CERSUDRAFT_47943 [Gelatoporia subvermispora B]|uniref:Uncharacterized protein n=1 Tax=Ceriporiopsis subvermispora (strain B) TaxID=914234 RepID=M2RJI3_CERS8|nr:hypothetical protein CERSUDRAFT_47943 [Gelatoporia subvermispora B]
MPELTHAPGSTLSLGNIAEVEEPSAEQEQEQEQSNDLQTVVASSASAQALPTAGIVEDTSNTIPDPAITEDVAAAEDAIDDLTVPPDPALSEPELPDPFVVDESAGQSLSASVSEVVEPSPAPSSINLEQSVPAVDEIALAQSTILSPSASSSSQPLPSPNLNKAVPSPPAAESDDEDAPDLYLPSLLLPTMFLPIPNTDPLTSLLMKYVPPERRPARDLTGEWQRSEFPTLVMTNSWRALARMARDRLLEADPEDLTLVLSLWYLRLASLARLRLFNQTSAECTNLFSVLNGIEPPSAREWVFERALPFELEVLHARLKYWAGDHMGHLDALAALLRKCRTRARARPADAEMWRERGARVALILASHLIEMKDFAAAARLLGPLCEQAGGVTSPAVRSSVGRVYLQSGCIAAAAQHFHAVAQDPTADPALKGMNAALLATAEGDWSHAASELQRLLQADPEHFVAVNNLAVAYLNQGKLQEGIRLLEEAIRAAPSTVLAAEPLLFNISTMYELRSTAGMDKKRDLLIEVAKWAGDGLRTTCLKMPTN